MSPRAIVVAAGFALGACTLTIDTDSVPPPDDGNTGQTHSISGTVNGASLVTMTLSGASTGTTTTGVGGVYTFTGLSNGSYTVTPSKTSYTFTPTSLPVTVSGANVTYRSN
jgi:hypothetical protein